MGWEAKPMWPAVPMATVARAGRASRSRSPGPLTKHAITLRIKCNEATIGPQTGKFVTYFSGLAPANRPQRASAGLHAIADGLERSGEPHSARWQTLDFNAGRAYSEKIVIKVGKGKPSKSFALRFGGETIGLYDSARECADAYNTHRALSRPNGYSRREPRYRVLLAGERITVNRLFNLARAEKYQPGAERSPTFR